MNSWRFNDPANFTLLARFQDGYTNQIAATLHIANQTHENSSLLHYCNNKILISLHPFSAFNMALN